MRSRLPMLILGLLAFATSAPLATLAEQTPATDDSRRRASRKRSLMRSRTCPG